MEASTDDSLNVGLDLAEVLRREWNADAIRRNTSIFGVDSDREKRHGKWQHLSRTRAEHEHETTVWDDSKGTRQNLHSHEAFHKIIATYCVKM
jgi:hypothetical protein